MSEDTVKINSAHFNIKCTHRTNSAHFIFLYISGAEINLFFSLLPYSAERELFDERENGNTP